MPSPGPFTRARPSRCRAPGPAGTRSRVRAGSERGFPEAARILAEADYFKDWEYESGDGLVTVRVDLPRFFTNYQVRLAVSHSSHAAPKRRGRAPSRRGSAIERARAYGIDVTLLDSQLAQAPAQRVREMDANNQALGELRKNLRP